MLVHTLGSGKELPERWQLRNPHNLTLQLHYSAEPTALETAGGIATALPLLSLASEAFAVVNADVWCNFPLSRLPSIAAQMQAAQFQSWSVMVENPTHHPTGDFVVENGRLANSGALSQKSWTFSGIGVYLPSLFANTPPGVPAKLAPLLRAAADAHRAGAEIHTGVWHDIGTVERLKQLDAQLRQSKES
jgi:MurNAc alpha-1-phosphate uridylyltransferase